MRAGSVLAVVLFLSGCLSHSAQPRPEVPSCANAAPCGDELQDPAFSFAACDRYGVTMELATAVYDLPPGYKNTGFPAAQRIHVDLWSCPSMQQGGRTLAEDIQYATIGVVVQPVDGGPTADGYVYVLELLTGAPALEQAFVAHGWSTLHGNVSISPASQPPLRTGTLDGDSKLTAQAPYSDPSGTAPQFKFAYSWQGHWFTMSHQCQSFVGTTRGTVRAERGVLVKAMPPEGFLTGGDSQTTDCNVELDLSPSF